jgi:CelD/BcsL family acetyltransferase involved in cellulose biosynthesis
VAKVSEQAELRERSLLFLGTEDERWLDFVSAHPAALPFHHPSWSQLLSECYGHRPFVLAVVDQQERIRAGMPVAEIRRRFRRPLWVALPFTDRCPPLATDDVMASCLIELIDDARERAHVPRLEVHADLPGNDVHRRTRGVEHRLALSSDPALVFRAFSRSQVQRNVRKAERGGLILRRGGKAEDLTELFYRLHLRTRRRLGIPVQPRHFFELLWRRVIAPGSGFVLLAYHGRRPVAGAVFLTAGRTVVYKYGASDPSSWPLRPNHLIFADAIRWSCENGFAVFDFGRSELDNQGLRDFKSGWGAIEAPLVYATIGAEPPRVPGLIATSMLPPLIRKGPLWLCRAIGEVGYRHTA